MYAIVCQRSDLVTVDIGRFLGNHRTEYEVRLNMKQWTYLKRSVDLIDRECWTIIQKNKRLKVYTLCYLCLQVLSSSSRRKSSFFFSLLPVINTYSFKNAICLITQNHPFFTEVRKLQNKEEEYIKNILNDADPLIMSRETEAQFQKATHCYICSRMFNDKLIKV